MGYAIDIRALEIQLSAISAETMAQIRSHAEKAEKAGQEVFNTYAVNHVTTHPTIRSSIRTAKDSCTVTYQASIKWPKLEYVDVSPPLSQDTTGRNRQPVTVTGWRGKPVEVLNGFIWQSRLWRRDPFRPSIPSRGSRYSDWQQAIVYVSGRYLWDLDALPRPADVLTRCAGDLIKAVEGVLNVKDLGELDDPWHYWKDKSERYKFRLFNSRGK